MNAVEQQFESARRHLDAAQLLFDHDRHTLAIPAAYYALFNAGKALLIRLDEPPDARRYMDHNGLRRHIGRTYVVPGLLPRETAKMLRRASDLREAVNYRAYQATAEEAQWVLKHAQDFLAQARSLLTA